MTMTPAELRREAARARREHKEAATINHFAMEEGWLLSYGDNRGYWDIERDDEAATFPDDDAARAHVLALADAGSWLHKEAIRFADDSAAIAANDKENETE